MYREQLAAVSRAPVSIYLSVASYEGTQVATVDQNGNYQTAPIFLGSNDEMVAVWAVEGGTSFSPTCYFWRHYAIADEVRSLDFFDVRLLTQKVWVPLIIRQ